jgi:hypothetical protein
MAEIGELRVGDKVKLVTAACFSDDAFLGQETEIMEVTKSGKLVLVYFRGDARYMMPEQFERTLGFEGRNG